jgi:LysM repeat protein
MFNAGGAEAGAGAGAEAGHAAISGQEAAHAAAAKASAEATSLAAHSAAGHAAIGHAALVPGGEQAVSPIIQLIMRLPGAVGLTHSFFEWFSHMFMPGGHDLIGALDPSVMHLDAAGHMAALEHASGLHSAGLHATGFGQIGEHFTSSGLTFTSFSGFPSGDLPVAHSFPSMSSGAWQHLIGSPVRGLDHFIQDPANVGASADISNAQFEHAAAASDGALAGPAVTSTTAPNYMAGSQRLFSDNLGGGGHFNSITSNTSVPTTTSAIPASNNGVTFGQEASQMPAASAGDAGAMSGPSVGHTAPGAEMAGQSASSIDGAGAAGAVTDKFGGNNVLASDTPIYRPTTGGYYQPADGGSAGTAGGGDVTPLKAKQLTFEDIRKGVVNDHAKRLIDQIAAGKHPTAGKDVIDHVGHQARGDAHSGAHAVDGVGHHTIGKAYSAAAPESATAHAVHHHASHHLAHHAKHVELASNDRGADATSQQQSVDAQQSGDATQQAGTQQPDAQDGTQVADGADQPTDYTVEKGDCLWDIAEKQLGDGTRWTEIYKMNADVVGQNPDLIFAGTHLKLPGADQIADAGKYVVKPGDNLWNIAKSHLGNGTKWGDLYKANTDIIGANPRLILPGQQLTLPGANPSIAQATTAPAPVAAADPGAAVSTPVADAGQAVGAPAAHVAAQAPAGMDVARPMTQPVAMQPTGFEQQAATAAAHVAPAAQPQSGFGQPLQLPPIGQHQAAPGDGIPAATNGVISVMPQHELPMGPGAAGAASLPTPEGTVVSASLAPDLSLLRGKPSS